LAVSLKLWLIRQYPLTLDTRDGVGNNTSNKMDKEVYRSSTTGMPRGGMGGEYQREEAQVKTLLSHTPAEISF
jgi:hypothetical protein